MTFVDIEAIHNFTSTIVLLTLTKSLYTSNSIWSVLGSDMFSIDAVNFNFSISVVGVVGVSGGSPANENSSSFAASHER